MNAEEGTSVSQAPLQVAVPLPRASGSLPAAAGGPGMRGEQEVRGERRGGDDDHRGVSCISFICELQSLSNDHFKDKGQKCVEQQTASFEYV